MVNDKFGRIYTVGKSAVVRHLQVLYISQNCIPFIFTGGSQFTYSLNYNCNIQSYEIKIHVLSVFFHLQFCV